MAFNTGEELDHPYTASNSYNDSDAPGDSVKDVLNYETVADATHWTAVPDSIIAALDELAARVYAIENP